MYYTMLVEVFDPLGAPLRAPLVLPYERMVWGRDVDWDYFDTLSIDFSSDINATYALLPSGAGGAVVLVLTDLWNRVPLATLALNTSRILEGLTRVLASDHGSEAVLQGLGIEHGQARQSQSPAPVLAADALWTCVRWLLLPAPVLAVLGLCALHPAVAVVAFPSEVARAASSAPQHKWSLSQLSLVCTVAALVVVPAVLWLGWAAVAECLPSAFIAWAARSLFTAFVIIDSCLISPVVGPRGSVALLWGFVALLPWAVGRRSRWLQSAASLLLWAGVLSTPLGGLVGKELTMDSFHDFSVQAAVASLVLVAVHRVLLWAAGPEGIDVDPVTEGLGYSSALLTGLYISSCWHYWHPVLWLLAQFYMMALLAATVTMGDLPGAGRPMRSRIVAAATVYSVIKCIEFFNFDGPRGIVWGVAVAWFLVLGLCIWWDRKQQKSIEQPSKEYQQHVE
eukprot:m51a1_g10318 hypothetical protein (452) ;mRNA; r:32342-34149